MASLPETTSSAVHPGPGESSNTPALLALVYEELRTLAARYLQHERLDHTLQPTALVHEAFLRLAEADGLDWQGRAEFIALAAQQIRKILVDHARKHRAVKRGGNAQRLPLDQAETPAQDRDLDVLALDEALCELAERSVRQSRVVELRFFGGLGVEETAEVLQVSPGTVKGDWRAARAWLQQRIRR